MGLTLEESVKILTDDRCNGTQLDEVIASYRVLYTEKGRAMATLFPGARETLLAVRVMGIQIVVVSNKSYKGVCRMAEQLGIDGVIDLMMGADSAPFRKPDARLYTEVIVPHLTDPLFANAAGLRSCWASYGYGDESACIALAPEFIMPDIARLPELLQNITD